MFFWEDNIFEELFRINQVCEFFMKNDCRKGDKCNYIHDYDLCRYLFLKKCKYGDKCKYYHNGNRKEWMDKKNTDQEKTDTKKKYHGLYFIIIYQQQIIFQIFEDFIFAIVLNINITV